MSIIDRRRGNYLNIAISRVRHVGRVNRRRYNALIDRSKTAQFGATASSEWHAVKQRFHDTLIFLYVFLKMASMSAL